MKYALRDKQHWFAEWTAIGPRCTQQPEEAATFDTEQDALNSPAYAFPLMFFEVVPAPEAAVN